jgi:sulfate adenylyltransferase large subunit
MSVALALEATAPAAANDADDARHSLLRFITCGSVDDGKSTLIGRLLLEAGAVPDDAVAALAADSAASGNAGGVLDYSLLVDGLLAEREQGITIDVAYRYFATPRRSFIVADTPGHEQYTRNMATGASGADLAVILIDARKGVLPQTRRHSLIVSLVGVRHIVVAINKIDLIGFDELAVRAIEAVYRAAVAGLGFRSITVVPVSARDGDNIAKRSPRTPWHDGPTLLGWLEAVRADGEGADLGFVMPVQRVNRPDLDFRGFAGTVASGSVRPGDDILALPSGSRARVTRIVTFDGDLASAHAGQAVTLTLDREIDVSRGDVLTKAGRYGGEGPAALSEIEARLLVTADRRIAAGDSFIVQVGTASAIAHVMAIDHATDIESGDRRAAAALSLNDLGQVRLRFDRPVVVAPYAQSRALGSLILIDRLTNATAAMGTILAPRKVDAGDDRVVALRRVADRTLRQAMGPQWRQELAPAASWRIGSALLLGLIVTMATDNPALGLAVALLDAALRPLLRLAHRRIWIRLRERVRASRDIVSEGGGI